jgi:hypothetical protein
MGRAIPSASSSMSELQRVQHRYTQDLKAYLAWCQVYDRAVLRATRGERGLPLP